VTAACLASLGHRVVGWDPDADVVAGLARGAPPIAEPGLDELLAAQLRAGNLSFAADPAVALDGAQIVWVTFDTPVDAHDRGDAAWVLDRVGAVLEHVPEGALVIVSSQLPVGSVAELERRAAAAHRRLRFACSPENLRLGRALDAFLRPARIVVGTRNADDRAELEALLGGITDHVVSMSIESAEMTKHALNAFLATSVVFANEVATLCEQVGADAREVADGLRSDPRIGPRAYLAPGAAFAGGTLARDVTALGEAGTAHRRAVPLLDAVLVSNRAHEQWPLRTLEDELGDVAGRAIAVLGLTYTVGTSTLRRSAAIELCRALVDRGAMLHVHDPAAEPLPDALAPRVHRHDSAERALAGAEAVVVATAWPEYGALGTEQFEGRLVVDADGLLAGTLRDRAGVRYRTVGAPR
jgi:UDPglucose 6-dehydrogenase